MDEPERYDAVKEPVPQLRVVISSTEKDKDSGRPKDDGATDEWRCEFYLRTKNVTPREMVSVKYPAPRCESKTRCKSRLLTRSWRPGHRDDEDAERRVYDVNANTVNGLLDGLSPGKPSPRDDPSTGYDVGPDVRHPRLDIVAERYEIELAESPTFLVLDLPGRVTVKGDGDHGRTLRVQRDVYRNAEPLFQTDNVAQTVRFAGREHKGCQTRPSRTSAQVTQVNGFDVADAREKTASTPNGQQAAGRLDAKLMFLERILARNALAAASGGTDPDGPSRESSVLTRRFRLSLRGNDDRGLPVRCVHWNETEKHLLAVAYGRLLYRDYRDRPNAVALWSTRNPFAPERFYEFEESTITCLKFSAEAPNRLAVGFYDGEVLIIDVSSKSLKILFRKSKQSALDPDGILDLFWYVRTENEFPRVSQNECLVTCSFNGHVVRYRRVRGSMTGKTIMRLSAVGEQNDGGDHRGTRRAAVPPEPSNDFNASCAATRVLGLDPNTYVVGTGDGHVYACCYDDPTRYASRTAAHFGPVKSLDRSPYSRDVYLTTGCDCCVKIWVANVFVEPVITLRAGRQIAGAAWSRTSPTVIVSLHDDCSVHVWDLDASRDEPTSVHRLETGAGRECTGLEFTSDGRHLCVSDVGGRVDVYAWPDGGHRPLPGDRLQYCVAKSLYGQTYLAKTLCKERPEYADAFARLHAETRASYFS